MSALNLIFPHQLFEQHALLNNGHPFLLVEEYLFFRQYHFHRQKLLLHRASMKYYEDLLLSMNKTVQYVSATDELSDIRKLLPQLAKEGVKTIYYIDPVDDWLQLRLIHTAKEIGIVLERTETPMFLNTEKELRQYFSTRKKFFQTDFYIHQRKTRGILLENGKEPLGGKWTYDTENRMRYPKNKIPPAIPELIPDEYFREAREYVIDHFEDNPGELSDEPLYPHTHVTAKQWLEDFLEHRFAEFGPYEDAMVADRSILHHSVISPLLNNGLLDIRYVLERTLSYAAEKEVPLASLEGFIRQLIGWREFMRALYILKGREARNRNYWRFDRKLSARFYSGDTGILPVDRVIKRVLETGYCHHIERLMVLGNFMLLTGTDPDEVYRWFMELFIDAYDWVMVPNVYSMSQFADGGIMATKPYISGSNYLQKMSDFGKGDWQQVWDGLFWKFMADHRDFFSSNPRLGMLLKTLDKMDPVKKEGLWAAAEGFIKNDS